MKNVTITLDENVAAQARIEAATQGKSLSKFVSDLLVREVGRGKRSQLDALEEFLSGPLLPLSDEKGRLPTREELYAEREDELLRRYEHSRLRDR